MLIRPYEENDWKYLMAIHDAARMEELRLAQLETAFVPLEQAAENEGLFDYTVEVAVIDGRPTGFIAYSHEEIAWLYVAPAYGRQGIGTGLVRHVLEQHPTTPFLIEVLWGNEPAKNLYEKMGFEVDYVAEGVMPGNEDFGVKVYCMERRNFGG